MSAPREAKNNRSILFADIVSSTALYERLGDTDAKKVVGVCLDAIAELVVAHHGTVVKHLGDGLMCSFTKGVDSVEAAVAMCKQTRGSKLEISVGIHRGEVVEDDGDIFGDAVNTASRIAALAKPSEILISRAMRDAVPPALLGLARTVPAVAVKGKREPIELLAIGEEEEESMLTMRVDAPRRYDATMKITYQDRELTLRPESDLTIGRDADNGLVVLGPCVSRLHARISHRFGKFVLKDQSSNGTFLVPLQQPKLHLIREEAILPGSGEIYLGTNPDGTHSDPIGYSNTDE